MAESKNIDLFNELEEEIGTIRGTDLDNELLQITSIKKDIPKYRRVGGWIWIKKVNATVLDWVGRSPDKLVEIEIKALKPNKYTRNTTERFLINEHSYIEMFEHIKDTRVSNANLIDIAKDFYRKIILSPNEYIQEVNEYRSEIFGINGVGDLILPTEYKISNEEKFRKDTEFQEFLKAFEAEKPKRIEIEKVVKRLYKYLKSDDVSKVVFAYTMISPFRLFLMHMYNIPEFPYLLLTSISSKKGKSARCKLFINRIMLGSVKRGSSSKDMKGSLVKIQSKQFITSNWLVDEMSEFKENYTSYKDLATDATYQDSKGEKSGKDSFTQTLLRGSITMTNNNTDWSDIPKPLLDRMIILNLEDVDKPYKNVDTDYKFLKTNGHLLTRYIWDNLMRYKNSIKEDKSLERDDIQKYILENGMNIVNAFFKDFNLPPLELNVDDVTNDIDDVVANDRDLLRSKLLYELTYITSNRSHSVFSIPAIAKTIDKDDYELESAYKNIIVKSESYGLYVNEEGVIITSKFLNHLRKKYPREFKAINTLPKLKKNCFVDNDCVIYAHTKNGDVNKITKYYTAGAFREVDIGKPKYGLLWRFENE